MINLCCGLANHFKKEPKNEKLNRRKNVDKWHENGVE